MREGVRRDRDVSNNAIDVVPQTKTRKGQGRGREQEEGSNGRRCWWGLRRRQQRDNEV